MDVIFVCKVPSSKRDFQTITLIAVIEYLQDITGIMKDKQI